MVGWSRSGQDISLTDQSQLGLSLVSQLVSRLVTGQAREGILRGVNTGLI